MWLSWSVLNRQVAYRNSSPSVDILPLINRMLRQRLLRQTGRTVQIVKVWFILHIVAWNSHQLKHTMIVLTTTIKDQRNIKTLHVKT